MASCVKAICSTEGPGAGRGAGGRVRAVSPLVPTKRDSEGSSYQDALRMIGVLVDEKRGRDLNVVETQSGFVFRFCLDAQGGDTVMEHASHSELESLAARARSGRRGARVSERQAHAFQPAGIYADSLRALGFELDALGAHYVALEDVNGQFLLSFQYRDPAQGYVWMKRLAIVHKGELDAILRKAYARRKPAKARSETVLKTLAPWLSPRVPRAERAATWFTAGG